MKSENDIKQTMNWPPVCRFFKTRSVLALVSFCWLLLIFIIFSITNVFDKIPNDVNSVQYEGQYHQLNDRLNEANRQIQTLMSQNRELMQNLQVLNGIKKKRPELLTKYPLNVEIVANSGLTSEFEQSLRRLKQNTDEVWLYLKKRLDSKSMSFVEELRYNMIFDLNVLSQRDSRLRAQELKSLGELVQNRISRMQNPNDCQKAKKLVCDLNKNCGFGCQMHHLSHCLVAAMALNRTLIAKTNEWRTNSANDNVWNKVFQPLSDNCLDAEDRDQTYWKDGDLSGFQVIRYPIIDFIDPIPNFLPLVIPQQISEKIIKLSGEPFIWFIGQLLKYIMRPSDYMNDYIRKFKQQNQFNHPIVGIHVRRTDKIGTEAKFHSIDEYMHFVDDFYNKLDVENERKGVSERLKRRVYLATDEPDVWKTEITPFKEKGYVFTGDIKLSESADPMQRSGFDSLHNVIVDLMLLSQCDYIVCTFSSQICRLAFELMQTRVSTQDLSSAFYSLDDIYYFGGQVSNIQTNYSISKLTNLFINRYFTERRQ